METVIVTAPGYKRRTGLNFVKARIQEVELPDIDFRICARCGHWEQSGAADRCLCVCHDLGLNYELPS